MAIVYKAAAVKSAYTANATLATTDVINVAVGDLLVVGLCTNNSAGDPSGIADTAGNSWTATDLIEYGNSQVRVYYSVATSANANDLFTGTYSTTTCTKSIWAASFTPDAGETVSLDFSVTGGSAAEASPWETTTDNMDADADDAVGIAFFMASGAATYSSQTIGGNAASVLTPANGNGSYFYYIFTANANGVGAVTAVSAGTIAYSTRLLIFKSVAAASGSVVPQIAMFYNRLRSD